MTDTKITKAQISARLRRAGFTASRQTTTAVRGWYNFSRGYVVNADGSIRGSVEFCGGYSTKDEEAKEMVSQYASALVADGFDVEVDDDGKRLVISATVEEEAR